MDPEITALAGTASTTLVTLMATDAWQHAREGVVALWRRVHPDRAAAVGDELEAARSDLLTARAAGDTQSEEELRAEWQGRLRRLLSSEPAIIDDLSRLLGEIAPTDRAVSPPTVQTRMRASASGHGRVYQAGRDQHISET